MRHTKDYNKYGLFNSIFEYSPESPTGLIWRIDTDARNPTCKRNKGEIAGCYNSRNATVTYKGDAYYTHRIVYVLCHGSVDNLKVIDHINGNTKDNRISNLRMVTQSINARNSRMLSSNSTGFSCVFLSEKGASSKRKSQLSYVAQWFQEGKRKTKSFSVYKYGLLPAYAKACTYMENKLKELVENEGYSDRHGK